MTFDTTYTVGRKALLISIGNDGDADNALYETHHDLHNVQKLLICCYGYRREDITVIDDNSGDCRLKPTRPNIKREIRRMVGSASPGDHMFFYYAGHGAQSEDVNEEEEDLHDEYLILGDGQRILDDELREVLVDDLPPKTSLVAIFDCCHSGSILDLPHNRCNTIWDWKAYGNKRPCRSPRRRLHSHKVFERGLSTDEFVIRGRFIDIERPLPSRTELYRSQVSITERLRTVELGMNLGKKSLTLDTLLSSKSRVPDSSGELQLSPETMVYKCAGECVDSPTEKPHVVSISACMDFQITHEGPRGGFLTRALVDSLTDNPHPTYETLMRTVSSRYQGFNNEMQEARSRQKGRAVERRRSSELESEDDTLGFDIPQISSIKKLNMRKLFSL